MLDDIQNFLAKFYFENINRLDLLYGAAVLAVLWLVVWGLRLCYRPPRTRSSRYPRIGAIKFWLFMTAIGALLVAAWARPYSSQSKIAYRRGQVEVIFLVDGSASMYLRDIGLARLDVAIREILKLLSAGTLREGDRAALFLFGKVSSRRVYLTRDLNDLFATEVSRVGRPQTLLQNEFPWGSEVVTALEHAYQSSDRQDRFAEFGPGEISSWQPKRRTNRLMILFSDGDFFNYLGEKVAEEEIKAEKEDLKQALSEIRRRAWKIYAVGIGQISGERLEDILKDYRREEEYSVDLERELKDKVSRLEVNHLEEIARTTGGRVFLMETAGMDARDFLKKAIDEHRPVSIEPVADVDKQEWWWYFLMAGLICLAVGIIFY